MRNQRLRFVIGTLVAGALAVPVIGAAADEASAGPSGVHVVTTTTEIGDETCDDTCTIRDAEDDASNDGVFSEIVLQTNMTYTLTCDGGGEIDAEGVKITGNGATIDQDCAGEAVIFYGVFSSLTVDDTTITGGTNSGIAGGANFPLTVTGSTITGNMSPGTGGGVSAVSEPVTVIESTIPGTPARRAVAVSSSRGRRIRSSTPPSPATPAGLQMVAAASCSAPGPPSP
jgi:hypothetical protein